MAKLGSIVPAIHGSGETRKRPAPVMIDGWRVQAGDVEQGRGKNVKTLPVLFIMSPSLATFPDPVTGSEVTVHYSQTVGKGVERDGALLFATCSPEADFVTGARMSLAKALHLPAMAEAAKKVLPLVTGDGLDAPDALVTMIRGMLGNDK